MILRLAGAVLTVCALSGPFVAGAAAEVPSGPRLAVLRYVAKRTELLTVDDEGGQARPVPGVRSKPSWSADGSTIAFSKSSGSRRNRRTDVYFAAADGSDQRRIPGTRGGFDPVLSPDGHTLAFARQRMHRIGSGLACCFRTTVWLLDLSDHSERRITPWRREVVEAPASFTPDGSTLAVEREEPMGAEIRYTVLALPLTGGPPTTLVEDATEPAYSPDGTRLALIVAGNQKEVAAGLEVMPAHLAVADADGSGLRRLTHSGVEAWGPSWDPSGQRLAYLQLMDDETHQSLLDGDSIMEINPDGSCRTKVLSYPNTLLYSATWQPGPGREAGLLAC